MIAAAMMLPKPALVRLVKRSRLVVGFIVAKRYCELITPAGSCVLDGTRSIFGNLFVGHILEFGATLVWHRFATNLCTVHMGGMGP